MDVNKYPLPHPQVAARVLDDQAIVVLADSGEITLFNPVGTRVWELSDGTRSVQQIAEQIVAEYGVTLPVALQDVTEFLQSLLDAQAIVLQDTPGDDGNSGLG